MPDVMIPGDSPEQDIVVYFEGEGETETMLTEDMLTSERELANKKTDEEKAAADKAAAEKAAGEKPAGDQQQPPGDDDDDDEHAQPPADATDAEREQIRQQRREERKRKKEFARERDERQKREIDTLRAQLQEVNEWKHSMERRQASASMAQLDKAIQDSKIALDVARQRMQEATSTANGAAQVEATEAYYAIRRRLEGLTEIKGRVTQGQTRPAPIDPIVHKNASTFMDAHKTWYDPQGRDMDSRVVLSIDQTLTDEGWDPRQPGYWQELEERAKKYLPHRFASGYNAGSGREDPPRGQQQQTQQPANRPAPPTGGSSASSTSSRTEYKLSAERVRALKDAGAWDDPKLRADAIRRFRDYDREHQS